MKQQNSIHPLRAARLRHGWTQQHLADFAQVSLSSVIRAEQGIPMRVDISMRLAQALGKEEPREVGLLSIGEATRGKEQRTYESNLCPQDHLTASAEAPLGQRVILEVESNADMNRRDVLQYLGGAGAAIFTSANDLPDLLSIKQAKVPVREISQETIDALREMLAACWKLSASDLLSTEQVLHPLLAKLIDLTRQPSRHQKSLARLVVLGYSLAGILAMHRFDFDARARHNKQALQYAQLTEDQEMYVASLVSMSGAYFVLKQPAKMLHSYQCALHFTNDLSMPHRARINLGAADAYALCGHREEALQCLGSAFENLTWESEMNFRASYLDTGVSQIYLWAGLTYLDLKQPQQALNMFSQVETMNAFAAIPERIRVELVNLKARTAVALRDMEQSVAYVQQGVQGAHLLGSEKRYNEALETYQHMCVTWPHEPRVQQIAALFRQSVGA